MTNTQRLQMEKEALRVELSALHFGINYLRNYLESEKFHTDTTVQVSDVLSRIEELKKFSENEREWFVQTYHK